MTEPSDDLYEFAPDPAPKSPPQRTRAPRPPAAETNAPVVLSYQTRENANSKSFDAEKIKDVYLPLSLLGGGIVVQIFASMIWTHAVADTIAELAVDMSLGTGVMLLAMLIAARIRAIDLGKLGVAAYKLAAIAIAPAAVVEFLSPVTQLLPLGGIIGLIVEFILFFALIGALFDLDDSDTWYCLWTMVFTRIAFTVLLRAIFHS